MGKENPRFCINCDYHILIKSEYDSKTSVDACELFYTYNLVNGEKIFELCQSLRKFGKPCGEAGVHFKTINEGNIK